MIGKVKKEVGNFVGQSCCFYTVWWGTAIFDLSSENNERFLPLICFHNYQLRHWNIFCMLLFEASSNPTSLAESVWRCCNDNQVSISQFWKSMTISFGKAVHWWGVLTDLKLIWNKLLTNFITKLPRVFHIFSSCTYRKIVRTNKKVLEILFLPADIRIAD